MDQFEFNFCDFPDEQMRGTKHHGEKSSTLDENNPNNETKLTKENRRKVYKTEDKEVLSSQANQLAVSRKLFAEIQERMGAWLSDNYGRMIDLFRKFDADQSGQLSYDEFFQGMKELGCVYMIPDRVSFRIELDFILRLHGRIENGKAALFQAPLTVVEMYVIALALDADNDSHIDFKEFTKLKRSVKQQAPSKPSLQPVLEIDKRLPPCPHCKLGISEIFSKEIEERFVTVQFKCFTFLLDKNFHGHFRETLSTSTSVYSVKRLIQRHLGGSATNLTVSTGNALRSYDVMDEDKTLEDYGIVGALENEKFPETTLFYDFEYPLLNCPIMNADFL